MPVQESSQVRSAQSARSYEDMERVANPTAARRRWARWSSTRLLEHLVRPRSHARRNGESEGLRHHAIDDELVARHLFHRKVAGSGALDNAVDECGRTLRNGGKPRPIGDQNGAGTGTTFPRVPGPDDRQFAFA